MSFNNYMIQTSDFKKNICFISNKPITKYVMSICIYKGLVTNYGEGGLQNGRGGASEVLPLRKGGAEKVLAILKGGAQKV